MPQKHTFTVSSATNIASAVALYWARRARELEATRKKSKSTKQSHEDILNEEKQMSLF